MDIWNRGPCHRFCRPNGGTNLPYAELSSFGRCLLACVKNDVASTTDRRVTSSKFTYPQSKIHLLVWFWRSHKAKIARLTKLQGLADRVPPFRIQDMGVAAVVKQLICKNQLQAVPSTQFASSSGSFGEICPWSWLVLDESLLGLLARSTANRTP